MRRISHDVALCCVLLILVPMPCFSSDLPTGPPDGSVATEICFPIEDGERMLKDLEALPPTRAAVAACGEANKSHRNRALALEGRIAEQDREIVGAKKTIEDTRKAGEQAAKVAAGPWYQRILNAGKWIALGIVVGFVGGMAK